VLMKRSNVVALSVIGLALASLAAYFLFFARPGYVEGRPTVLYFRLST